MSTYLATTLNKRYCQWRKFGSKSGRVYINFGTNPLRSMPTSDPNFRTEILESYYHTTNYAHCSTKKYFSRCLSLRFILCLWFYINVARAYTLGNTVGAIFQYYLRNQENPHISVRCCSSVIIKKIWISPSLWNWIGIVRFEFESNREVSQVPTTNMILLC